MVLAEIFVIDYLPFFLRWIYKVLSIVSYMIFCIIVSWDRITKYDLTERKRKI